MRFMFRISRPKVFSVAQASAVLPQEFSFEERDEDPRLVLETPSDLTHEQGFELAQRECERLCFLTGEWLAPTLLHKESPDGSIVRYGSFTADALIVKPIPPDVDRQRWTTAGAVQLRLWRIVTTENLPTAAQINLLFQIVEIAHPHTNDPAIYPVYTEADRLAKRDPEPLREALLLRHLSSHGYSPIGTSQLKTYCQHHNIPEYMHDPTSPEVQAVLKERLHIVKEVARRVIEPSITRRS